MEKFQKYFDNITILNGQKYDTAYSHFKPYIIKRTREIKKSISPRGRPVEMNYDKFFDALFFVVNEGLRYNSSNLFGIP